MDTRILQEIVGADIAAILPTSMHALTRPKANGSLGQQVPAWEQALLAKHPNASAECVRAGLWLLADEMDTAHGICQDVHTSLGSAWHAHLHRREPDYFNAMYWWRRVRGLAWTLPGTTVAAVAKDLLERVKTEAVHDSLRRQWIEKLTRGVYDPADLAGAVEASEGKEGAWVEALRDVQRAEWAGLMWESVKGA